jgi:transposase-like protein
VNIHKNARLTPHSRAELVRRVIGEGQTPKAVATAFGVCAKTVRKWVARPLLAGGPDNRSKVLQTKRDMLQGPPPVHRTHSRPRIDLPQ